MLQWSYTSGYLSMSPLKPVIYQHKTSKFILLFTIFKKRGGVDDGHRRVRYIQNLLYFF